MSETSSGQSALTGKLRLGMVGGGQGAFIGAVHRIAARIDGDYELVAGALSSDRERAKVSANELGISAERSYGSFQEMATGEAERADGIDAVAIVTPNHIHFPAAKAFLEAGIHVICDKPLTSTLEDAVALAEVAKASGKEFILTHNYSGYPMIRQAREMVANGALGEIRLVQMEYAQDWLTEDLESSGQKQASWRTDPTKSGVGGCIGDIGTHAYQLGSFVSGLTTSAVLADLTSFIPGRRVDDNVSVLLRFENGAKGMLWASQIAPGNENSLSLRIFGERGGLEWHQENPNQLWYTPFGEPKRLLTRGGSGSLPSAERVTRVPAGHPEGYLEGFATLYQEAARKIRAAQTGSEPDAADLVPGIEDGLAGMAFIDACIRSSNDGSVWIKPKS